MKRLPSTRHKRSGSGSPRRHHATGQTEGSLAGVLFPFLSVLVALPAHGLISSVPCPPSSTDYGFSLARYVACPPSRWPARRIFRGSLAISPPPHALDGGPRAGPVPSRTGSDGPSERVGRRAELRRAHAADPAPPARPVRAPTSPGPARGSEQGLPSPSVRALRRVRLVGEDRRRQPSRRCSWMRPKTGLSPSGAALGRCASRESPNDHGQSRRDRPDDRTGFGGTRPGCRRTDRLSHREHRAVRRRECANETSRCVT
jgi:hypothetical protein